MMSNIQWFPGHMTKAKRNIEQHLKSVDMVIECRDSRAPQSSSNPLLNQLIGQKPRLIVLTKKDLAIGKDVEAWLKAFETSGTIAISVDIFHDNIKTILEQKCSELMAPKHERDLRRGIRPRAIRALIVGIPNVGKSTLINRLAKRNVVRVENRPGITQALKLIKVSKKLEIVDSPGMLWPKFDDQRTGIILSLVGSIKDTGYPLDLISDYALKVLVNQNNLLFKARYKLEALNNSPAVFAAIAQSKGYFIHDNPDIEKARQIVIQEMSNGVYGPMMWELPDEN